MSARIAGPWLTAPATVAVFDMLLGAGHQAYFVGGCVRNALMDRPVSDLDIASDALPEEVIRLAEAAGLRAVPTGISHGTVTVVAQGTPFEVTSFRKDIETDGRHATVRFGASMSEDAARRDFTVNALYADRDGHVLDPLGLGISDLAAGRIAFIGDAVARLAEDHLRALRYFRFVAWYGDPQRGVDLDALAAISAALEHLEGLSAERIGAEMRKLLSAPDPAPAVAAMQAAGVLAAVLPGTDARALPALIHFEAELSLIPAPIRRLAALGGADADLRLRLSRAEARELAVLRAAIGTAQGAAELGYRLGAEAALDVLVLRAALLEMPPGAQAAQDVARGAAARCPVEAADLMPRLEGPQLGATLRAIEARWIASGFTLSREALLARD